MPTLPIRWQSMSTILITLFLSITVLANAIQAVPSHDETIISQLARTIYGEEGFGYVGYVMTIAGAFAILFMAANTPFADFPQLAALSSAGWLFATPINLSRKKVGFQLGNRNACRQFNRDCHHHRCESHQSYTVVCDRGISWIHHQSSWHDASFLAEQDTSNRVKSLMVWRQKSNQTPTGSSSS
ncbi:MAG UNVERIFIED_CONTAM: hypothetical protein LVT10_11395 [Anaerolineae bacterium]